MHVVSRVLLRAPLLAEHELDDAERALLAHALGESALRLASPSLVAHADERAQRARRRYARRAAFRATPHGLLAGVSVATLGERTSIALGAPRALLAPRFARLASLARALLDTDAGWRQARLRRAPSLFRFGDRVRWLTLGDDGAVAKELQVDELLELALKASANWTKAASLTRRLTTFAGDDARALVLELIDDGLLHHDLEPPLVGPPPAEHARRRLAPLCPDLSLALDRLDDATTPALTRIEDAERRWRELPGANDQPALHATLVHAGDAQVSRAMVERAAALAPVLFALAEALHPPVAESAIQPGLAEALDAAGMLGGEGLLALPALELGAYGARLRDEGAEAPRPSTAMLAYLAAQVVEAARDSREALVLSPEDLAALLPRVELPSTYELQLSPARDVAWLLGLHAPAGATWGRFAHALGEEMSRALRELREAEASLDGEALRVDVSYAPTAALADLCAVPALRDAALAISSWPEDAALVPADCAIASQPASVAHGGFAVGGRALRISALHRVRSSTAPPSVWRALLGDTLHRQHAPWAFGWGALAALPWLPRVVLDSFVIVPQSWALPEPLTPDALRAWRSRRMTPRHVQVGAEDALLPIDLDDEGDRLALCALPAEERRRAFEIWPPLGQTIDRGGRRVEIVAAVVRGGEEARTAALGAMDLVPPPRAASGWRTLKIYAPRELHAELLVEQIAPFTDQRGLRGWFFLPYVDPPARDHLRVRLRARDEAAAARLTEAWASRLRVDPRVVTVEVGAYHAEHARWGTSLPAVERVFESDSRLVVALAADDLGLAEELLLVATFDALAEGLALDARARLDVAERAFASYDVSAMEEREALAPGYRALQRALLALLDEPPAPFVAHRKQVRAARLTHARHLVPALLHLAAVRQGGADRDAEVRALYLWKRALESRRATRRRARRSS